MFYVIDYNSTELFIRPYADGATEIVSLLDGYQRLTVEKDLDLDVVDADLLLRIANGFLAEPATVLPPEASRVVWGFLTEVTEDKHIATVTPADKPAKKKREKSKKNIQKSSAEPLEGGAQSATSDAPQGSGAPDATKEGQMAKSKKSVKKSAKSKSKKAAKSAKASNGLPREGSKKAKLLAAVTKPGGATMKQLIALTGWKACRGTLGQVVEAAGKTLSLDKETGRYTAK